MAIDVIKTGHFSGGRNLAERGDSDPSERQLDDLIIELQEAINDIEADPAYESVLDILLTPPGAPTTGDRYLINGVGVGAWAGHDYEVAEWSGSAWTFEAYNTDDLLLCSGTLNPANEGFWRKGTTAWSFLGSESLEPCIDIVLDPSALTPVEGDRYLINGVGAGAFAGHDYEVAQWNAGLGAWAFTSHPKGTLVTVSGDITPANFGSYIKGTTTWELIPAVASAMEIKPNGRAVKGRFTRIRNQVGDYTYTGYRPTMGTFIVVGNTNAGAGVYYFRIPPVSSTPNATYATFGWDALVYCPPTSKGTVVVRAWNNSPIFTMKPGELWAIRALYVSGSTPASWNAMKVVAGPGLDNVTGVVVVDGTRTDIYTANGTDAFPYKTIQAGLDACPRGGLVKVRKAEYVENVVTVADKHIDADIGTLLRSPTGDTLTFTDDAVPPVGGPPLFVRGLNVQAEDPLGWALRVQSLGTWGPFIVLLDQVLKSLNAANIIWCEGGGVYLTDAGGTDGDPPICCRVGRASDPIGGSIITGRYNLNCAAGGKLFEIHENGFVIGDGAGMNNNGPGATLAELLGKNTPGTFVSFQMRFGSANSGWATLVRSTGENVSVHLDNDSGEEWGGFSGDVFDMPDGGSLALNDGIYSSSSGRFLRFGNNVGPSNGQLRLTRTRGISNGGWAGAAAEIAGNLVSGALRESSVEQRNSGASGTLVCQHAGALAIVDGLYEGPGPTIDVQSGQLWLLGGADIVPTGVGLPGSIPIAVGIAATLHRGHVNIRSGAPLIAGTENLLPSSFGVVELGPLGMRARIGVGRVLPGGGAGYGAGSIFILVPLAGQQREYINIGTESAPTWVEFSYVPAAPANWAGPAPTNGAAAWDRLAAAVAGLLGGPIP